MTPNVALGILFVLAALAMAWSNQRITTAAGFGSPTARWALVRRTVYVGMAIALARIGLTCLDGDFTLGCTMQWKDSVALAAIAFGILLFPMLRALGIITQDTFVGSNGSPGHAGSSYPPSSPLRTQ